MIYIPYTLSGILTLVIVFILFRKKRTTNKYVDKMQKIAVEYKLEIKDLNLEVERQNLILSDYKHRLQLNASAEKLQTPKEEDYPKLDETQNTITSRQELEKEKEQFKQKNQKLWEQSIAVYKEKERIDTVRKYIESRHVNLTNSINYALRIQKALLPTTELLEQIIPNHFILYKPRDIVSGDFYWTKQIGRRSFLIAADCTGHGVPGAFMSLLGISYLNEIVNMNPNISAAQLLEELRYKVKSGFKQNDGSISIQDGMDMATCIIDQETLRMEFAGANNGLYHIRNKDINEVKGTKNPISAYIKEKPFENHIIQLQTDDMIIMYSDGYFDQFGGSNKDKLKRKRFNKTLNHCVMNDYSMPKIKSKLEEDLADWQGQEIQVDDILIFGVRI